MDGWMLQKHDFTAARNAEDHRLLKSSGFNISISSVYDAQAWKEHMGAPCRRMDTGGGRAKKGWDLGNGIENMDSYRDGNDFQKMQCKIRLFQTDFGVFERFNYAPNPRISP